MLPNWSSANNYNSSFMYQTKTRKYYRLNCIYKSAYPDDNLLTMVNPGPFLWLGLFDVNTKIIVHIKL